MILKQFYQSSLGHASYFVGSEETGEALVLDVRRDVDGYFAEARRQGMRIAYACDTHQHNDYLSGICELPERGEAQLLAGARAELGYRARRLEDRQRLEMGEVVFQVLHTPGHTPEHIALLITDRSRSEEPMMLLSGGALLVGDVARPDLLGGSEQVQRQARTLCRTLGEQILSLPDHVEVYPTHVAGSLCGGHIARRLSTTIGFERRANAMLKALDQGEESFLDHCVDLDSLPAVPPYWGRMRRLNQQGPPLLGTLAEPPAMTPEALDDRRKRGAVVLDCRSPEAFHSHIPGAVNVGAGASFATWAGTVLPEDAAVVLVLDAPGQLSEICLDLLRIGYPMPDGWLAGGMRAWRVTGRPLGRLPAWSVAELHRRWVEDRQLFILDVRQPAEWRAGHIPGAHHITGAQLPQRLEAVPADRPVAVICGSGYRSSVAASLLLRQRRAPVVNVMGGMTAWHHAGHETEH